MLSQEVLTQCSGPACPNPRYMLGAGREMEDRNKQAGGQMMDSGWDVGCCGPWDDVAGSSGQWPAFQRCRPELLGLVCWRARVPGPCCDWPDSGSQEADCRGMRHPSLVHPPGSSMLSQAPHQLCPSPSTEGRSEVSWVGSVGHPDDDVAMASFIHLTILSCPHYTALHRTVNQ